MTPRLLALRQRGVTLVEMMVTVALLALVASLAIPDTRPASTFAADAAAGEVARAIRFAQREAVRTGVWHGARFDPATQSLKVFRVTVFGLESATPVLHPVDKSTYEVKLGNTPGAIGMLSTVEFKYKTRTVTNFIAFRPDDGMPASINPLGLSVDLLERDGKVVLAHGSVQRELTVARVTGRVSW